MSKILVLAISLNLTVGSLRAQLNLLTLREAESLVERVPDVAASIQLGECPNLSATFDDPDKIFFQVRRACGPRGGELISPYTVNRRTGAVVAGFDKMSEPVIPETKELARQLMIQARNRGLSLSESECLAIEAARALPGWNRADEPVSVKPFGTVGSTGGSFIVSRRWLLRPADSGRMLTVDPASARVRDDETGMYVMSEGLGSLTAKMIALREPPWLSQDDTITVALQVPQVAKALQPGCRLWSSGAFRAEETQVGISCGAGLAEVRIAAAMNLRTGSMTDLSTGKPMESDEASKLAAQLLLDVKQRKVRLEEDLRHLCNPN